MPESQRIADRIEFDVYEAGRKKRQEQLNVVEADIELIHTQPSLLSPCSHQIQGDPLSYVVASCLATKGHNSINLFTAPDILPRNPGTHPLHPSTHSEPYSLPNDVAHLDQPPWTSQTLCELFPACLRAQARRDDICHCALCPAMIYC